MARPTFTTSPASLVALALAAGSVASVAHGQSWAVAGNGTWFNAANWSPATVPTGAGATATLGFATAYTVDTTSNTLMGVNITNPLAVLAINGTNNLTLDGAVNNVLNGSIKVNTNGAYQGTHLNIVQPGTAFSGTGSIRLNASTSDGSTTSLTALVHTSGSGTLTMNAGTTLGGFGLVSGLPTTNNGTFTADIGRLLRIDGATHQNNALYTSAGGGTLLLINTTVNQSAAGSLAPGANSEVQLTNATINGGSITSTATGRVSNTGSSTSTLSGVTINGGMDLDGTSFTYIGAPGVVLAGGATVRVNTNSTYQGTHIRTNAPNTPFSGSGTVRLQASTSDGSTTSFTAAISEGGSGTGSYLFGPGVTVAGFGIVSNVPTTNNGTFNADVTSRLLRVENNVHQNNSLYTATNGGTLLLSAATITQAPGAAISAAGTSGDGTVASNAQLANTSVTGGSITSNGNAHVQLNSGANATLTGVAINGAFDQYGATNLYLDSPGITLNGGATILVNHDATYQGTHIRTGDANTAINGNGTVRLNSSSSDGSTTSFTAAISEDGGDAGGSYVFAPGITVAGFGIVNNVPTTNNGRFSADVNGRNLRIEGSAHQNNNLYESTNGGTLLVSGTTVTQSGSARTLAGDGSVVDFTNSRVNGGTVGSLGGGTGVSEIDGGLTLDGVSVSRQLTLNGGGTLILTDNGITLTNNALVKVNTGAAFNGTRIRADGAPTPIGGTGTIYLNASSSDGGTTSGTADLTKSGGGGFTFGSGVTVAGFGRISDCPTTNNGVVDASTPGRPLRIEGNTHQNNNIYRSSFGGTLTLVNETLNQSPAGVVNAGDFSAVSLNGGVITGGSLTASGSGRFAVGATGSIGGLTSGAPIDINAGTVLFVNGPGITNNGLITVNTSANFNGTGFRANAPATALNGSGGVRLNRSSSDGGTTSGTADIGSSAAGNFFSFGAGQTLSGSGRINGSMTMGGIVSPGSGAGNVSFIRNESGGTLSFTNTGRLRIDRAVNGTFDSLVNAGTVSMDGTLEVNTAVDLPSGTTMDVINGGALAGQFDQVLSSGLATPKRFGARYDVPGKVRVTVLCGPADIAGQGADGNGDGVLDNNDFIVFIDRFFTNDPRADYGITGGIPGSDGLFNNNDYVVFIDLFFAGCF